MIMTIIKAYMRVLFAQTYMRTLFFLTIHLSLSLPLFICDITLFSRRVLCVVATVIFSASYTLCELSKF